jgi:HemY protein
MIRVLVYLLLVAALAVGCVWLADRPGDVVIVWLGRRVETSVMVLVLAVILIAVLTTLLWSLVRGVIALPRSVRDSLRTRRSARGYLALSHGLIAVGSGNVVAARRFAEEASRLAPEEPLTLLLRAQTAQLTADREDAARNFELMASRNDTRLLGLHGLFIEARRRSDPAAALFYAEQAAEHASVPTWAAMAVLEFRCAMGDWEVALKRLQRNMESGLIDKATFRRQRAVLLTAQALAVEDSDRDRAKTLALEAVKLAPSLVPGAVLAGRFLSEAGEQRKAARIITTAWGANPHPDLADVYAHLRPGDSARERLRRIQALAASTPGNVEAALAVARAALDAQEFAIAREALAPLAVVPTKRVAALMAELEQSQHADEGRAREWMKRGLHARRDPAWTADGFVSERWLPVSPVSGRLDAFEWKDPLAGDDHTTAVIESERAQALEQRERATEPSRNVVALRKEQPQQRTETSPATEIVEPQSAASAPGESTGWRTRIGSPIQIPPAVIPLMHAPDDPGPDPDVPNESSSQSDIEESATPNWTRIRQLFR